VDFARSKKEIFTEKLFMSFSYLIESFKECETLCVFNNFSLFYGLCFFAVPQPQMQDMKSIARIAMISQVQAQLLLPPRTLLRQSIIVPPKDFRAFYRSHIIL